MQSRQKQIHIQ